MLAASFHMTLILTPACRGVLILFFASCMSLHAATLEFAFRHAYNGGLLKLDSPDQRTVAGEAFSIARISYLVSGVALERGDGSWLEFTNAVAWIDAQAGRTALRLAEVPAGAYRGVRFNVGLDAALNNAPVTNYPPDHALNPNLNGLHWSWQGGYIFLALEGMWRNAAGKPDGWSFHLARDTNRVRINLAANLDLARDARMEIDFDLAPVLNAPRPISFARDGSSTHSRDGDPVAAALVANLPGAFRVRQIEARDTAQEVVAKNPLFMPAKFTPFPFQMSAVFPMPDLPRDNPLIVERVALGENLFHDAALSKDGTVSCATCHESKAAFADPRRFSLGVRNQVGTRNAMPLFNLAWKSAFFWDGRAPTLRAQALMPIQDHSEMDESLTNVVAKLSGRKWFAAPFTAAFGSPEITAEKIGLAIEAFVLTLTSFDSKFDRAFRGEAQLSDEEKRGFELFMTEFDPRREQYGADCFHCHGGALFQSQTFANNGLDAAFKDLGRAKVTGRSADEGKFSTPSLRNIALTGPYMHDGRFATLEEVVEHYSSGVKRSATLDPNLAKHPDGGLRLSKQDKAALVAFLRTLTDEKFERATVSYPQP